MTTSNRPGFTLIELLIALTILSILAALAIPLAGDSDSLRLDAAERLLTSDIEHTQILAITHPEDEYALVIHDDGTGWHIARTEDPETPVLETETLDPLILSIGTGRGTPAEGVLIETNAANNMITFDQNGGLIDFTIETTLRMRIREREDQLTISSSTGAITYGD
ncbi:MAG: type II secretion system protein [Phycisphaerales bacterium]|jgi:prepilin-type N-terminal cleavage/methylation domain-containing protein|nr:type II secretion system protein [Phycisphaerales bacterium]